MTEYIRNLLMGMPDECIYLILFFWGMFAACGAGYLICKIFGWDVE